MSQQPFQLVTSALASIRPRPALRVVQDLDPINNYRSEQVYQNPQRFSNSVSHLLSVSQPVSNPRRLLAHSQLPPRPLSTPHHPRPPAIQDGHHSHLPPPRHPIAPRRRPPRPPPLRAEPHLAKYLLSISPLPAAAAASGASQSTKCSKEHVG
jgi:hypothetical protein